jgi:hypothetical protein
MSYLARQYRLLVPAPLQHIIPPMRIPLGSYFGEVEVFSVTEKLLGLSLSVQYPLFYLQRVIADYLSYLHNLT